jgi:hypothetical protein
MAILTRTAGGVTRVSINAAGQLVAEQGFESGPVTSLNTKWITRAEALAMLGGGAGSETAFCWQAKENVIAPVANPADSPCAYWQRIYIPRPMTLDRFQYGLRVPGTAVMGMLYCGLFSEVAGQPAVEYLNARARVLHSGRPVGSTDIYMGAGVALHRQTVAWPAAGHAWLACVVDTRSSHGIITPDIEYWQGSLVGSHGRAGYKVGPNPIGFATIAHLYDTDCVSVPAVYVSGVPL